MVVKDDVKLTQIGCRVSRLSRAGFQRLCLVKWDSPATGSISLSPTAQTVSVNGPVTPKSPEVAIRLQRLALLMVIFRASVELLLLSLCLSDDPAFASRKWNSQ